MISSCELRDPAQLRVDGVRRQEAYFPVRCRTDTAEVNGRVAVLSECRMPDWIGFGQDAPPTVLILEEPRITVNKPVCRAKFDEEALSPFVELVPDPKILKDL